MDEDDVFVGLPYVFKMEYDDLKQEYPRSDDSLERVRKLADKSAKNLETTRANLDKLKEMVSELFDNLTMHQQRSSDENSKSQ